MKINTPFPPSPPRWCTDILKNSTASLRKNTFHQLYIFLRRSKQTGVNLKGISGDHFCLQPKALGKSIPEQRFNQSSKGLNDLTESTRANYCLLSTKRKEVTVIAMRWFVVFTLPIPQLSGWSMATEFFPTSHYFKILTQSTLETRWKRFQRFPQAFTDSK